MKMLTWMRLRPETSDSQPSESKDQDKNEGKRSDDQKEKNIAPTGAASASPSVTGGSGGTNDQDSKSSSKTPGDTGGQQDDSASKSGLAHREKQESTTETHKDWFSRVAKEGQEVLWSPIGSGKCPTLLTGVQPSDLKSLETFGWGDKLETADLEKHTEYLRSRHLPHFIALPHPLEATAWENGFVPETHGLPSEELEPRMLPLLPQLSHMVSAPRQPVATGNALLTRFDANVRPYCRDLRGVLQNCFSSKSPFRDFGRKLTLDWFCFSTVSSEQLQQSHSELYSPHPRDKFHP